jgi:hypothetical protein
MTRYFHPVNTKSPPICHPGNFFFLDFHIESNVLALGGVGMDHVTNLENRYFCNHVNLLLLEGGGVPLLIVI